MDKYPEPENKDKVISVARALVKGAAGSVPVAGSFLAEIIDFLYKQPIDQLREDWIIDLAETLEEIQNKQAELTPEKLAEIPEFVTILHRATEVAVRTHQKEKRQYLRNAINSAIKPNPPDFDKQILFLRLVEELTTDHVLILVLYRDPKGWFSRRGILPQEFMAAGRDQVLVQAYPELAKSGDFRLLVISDLERRGLMGGVSGLISGHAIYDPITSKLGNEFLDYISAIDENLSKDNTEPKV
jgi:hypothetical protein